VSIRFECVTLLPVVRDAAFDLALNVDAHIQSMSRSGERPVGAIRSGQLRLDDEVTWRAKHFGVWWTMTSRITESQRPRRFVDEQVRGPFSRFHHEHLFEPVGHSTRMTDRVTFVAPLGPVGWVVERVFLARYLRQLIQIRNAFLLDASSPTTP
jgi:ligand-binding SRPBCC domain-containing protein